MSMRWEGLKRCNTLFENSSDVMRTLSADWRASVCAGISCSSGRSCAISRAMATTPFGVVVGKLEPHKSTGAMRGYIGMLVVTKPYRGLGVGASAAQATRRPVA